MFHGLGMEPFSFSFSNGVVTGPNYSFDLRAPLAADTEAARDFYRSHPEQLIHFVYEDWNKKFNPSCIKSGGNLYLGVEWDVYCLQQSGTPNLLGAAVLAIQPAIAAWGAAYLGQSPTGGGGSSTGGSTGGGTTGGGTTGGTTSGTGTGTGSQSGFLNLDWSSPYVMGGAAVLGLLLLFGMMRE